MVFKTQQEREAYIDELMASGGYGQAAGLNLMVLDAAAGFVGNLVRDWLVNSQLRDLQRQEAYYAQSIAKRDARIAQLDQEIKQLDREIEQLDREIEQLDREIEQAHQEAVEAERDLYETRVRNYIENYYEVRDNLNAIAELRPEALRLGLDEVVAKVDEDMDFVFRRRYPVPKDQSPEGIERFAHECARRNSDKESFGMIALSAVTTKCKKKLAKAIEEKRASQNPETIVLG
ncbi:hypothetical protein GN073_08750 [Helicobacter pylori]|nr:hypothetical protein [Helicobacter pylori]